MNNRLIAFLQAEELSSARFADIMQIQRSGVSHLLSGRNKPGYDFFEKFLQKFPAINIEWLISGRGKMYKEQANAVPQPLPTPLPRVEEIGLFATPALSPQSKQSEGTIAQDTACFNPQSESHNTGDETSPTAKPDLSNDKTENKAQRHIKKLIILYSDGSYDEKG